MIAYKSALWIRCGGERGKWARVMLLLEVGKLHFCPLYFVISASTNSLWPNTYNRGSNDQSVSTEMKNIYYLIAIFL